MLRIEVRDRGGRLEMIDHEAGPFEIGRGPGRDGVTRYQLQEMYVSRDHLRIEEMPGNLVRIDNLSSRPSILFAECELIPPGASRILPLPVHIAIGAVVIVIRGEAMCEAALISGLTMSAREGEGLPASRSAGRAGDRVTSKTPGSGDPVDCTVFAPPTVAPGVSCLVQVFAHPPDEAESARRMALEFDDEAGRRGFKSLAVEVERGSRLMFHLGMPGLAVDDPTQELTWNGRPESVQFGVTVPAERPPGIVIGSLAISLDRVSVGHIKFKLTVAEPSRGARSPELEPRGDSARRYSTAFISYASPDRPEVLKRVQMLAPMRIKFFQDLLDLEPGDRWERELYRQIDECDLFLLFWSSSAQQSAWVRKELEYALRRQGGADDSPPEIRPVILEGPPVPEPPPELAHLHFNDCLLYLLKADP